MALYKLAWNLKEDIDEGLDSPRIDIFEAPDIPVLFKELVEDNFLDELPSMVKEENGWVKYDTKNMEIFVKEMKAHAVGNQASHWW